MQFPNLNWWYNTSDPGPFLKIMRIIVLEHCIRLLSIFYTRLPVVHLEGCAIWYHTWYHKFMILAMISYVLNCLWYQIPMISYAYDIMIYIYDIIPLQCMISVTYDIIDLWYHNRYHMQNHIWYHGIQTMISYFWTVISYMIFPYHIW